MSTGVISILFSCVAANHLGLVSAVEKTLGIRLHVIDCPKCFSFWSVLGYCLSHGADATEAIAISFMAAYAAIWLELSMGFVDFLYNRIYDKIYTTDGCQDEQNTTSGDAHDS